MSYEKDLKHLKKEYKKSSEKLREAEICGHQADVDIWENDLVNISHQIYIHEQASKAEVYEKLPRDILQTIRTLQAEVPRTRDHLIAIGTYQTILNHLKSYGLEADEDEL